MANQPIQSQPSGVAMMSVSPPGGNRNALDLPFDEDGRRQWSMRVMDISPHCGEWCCSCWCPCFKHASEISRLRYLETHGQPHPQRGDSVNFDCLVYAMFCFLGLQVIPDIALRKEIRERYQIAGSFTKDACLSCFCSPNMLTQASQEMRLEEQSIDEEQSIEVKVTQA
ncbi:hypothetical protein DL93DRAFT_2143809 [Clavulina sp. PMI_390]|nr:hypothetical protein DL93DRAFT_2143809 [Clavulina sp. PMI_390]